jgi:uncharacterized damage-inducible protein DinB
VIHSNQEIRQAVYDIMRRTSDLVESINSENFIAKPIADKWSIAEEFDHLLKSNVAICSSLKRKPIVYQWKFGKPNRPLRNFDEVQTRYNERLASVAGAVAPSPFISKEGQKFNKEEMLKFWESTINKLEKRIKQWSDKQLDRTLLPHPLLGKLMVREMLFFMVMHTEHHYLSLKKKLESL